jgi:flagellar basal-body rod protein FlgB
MGRSARRQLWTSVLNGRLTLFVHLSLAMNFADIPILSMLKDRLSYLNQREQVIGQNVANADTPGYVPGDLKPFEISSGAGADATLALTPVQTNAAHLSGTLPAPPAGSSWRPHASPDSETRLDGNRVVLEEQMLKMQDARLNYETALGLYQKSVAMIQLALKAPGKP